MTGNAVGIRPARLAAWRRAEISLRRQRVAGFRRADKWRVAVDAHGTPPTAALCGFALAITACLICLRMPDIVLKGRLWAEEGRNFLPTALALPPLASLFHSYGGYLNLVANAAALVAATCVPLALAPWVTMATGLVFQLLPAALILTARDPWLQAWQVRIAALALLVLVPASEEVWLHSLHAQFELTLACGLLLALRTGEGRGFVARGAVLLLAPLCGPGAISLVPLFVLRAWIERSRRRLLQASVLAAGSALQLAVFTTSFAGRHYALDPVSLLCLVTVRHLVVPFLGLDMADRLTDDIRATLESGHLPLLGVLPPLLVGVPFLCEIRRETQACAARWLLAAAVLTGGAAYFGAINGAPGVIERQCGERYVFVPQALLALSLLALAATASRRGLARAARLAVVWLIAVGAWDYRSTVPDMTDGPAWHDEVRAWQHDPSHAIRLWPSGWTVRLPVARPSG